VAKVGTSHFREAELESLARELAVAGYPAEREAPVVVPARDGAAGPHHWGGVALTLWEYAEAVEGGALDPPKVAAVLTAVHEALGGFPGSLPFFGLELDDARRLLEPDRSPMLAAPDRSLLLSVIGELEVALPRLVAATRPVWESALGKLASDGGGLLLSDFETACRAPIEWTSPPSTMRPWRSFPTSTLS
jgi:hypothetical protein